MVPLAGAVVSMCDVLLGKARTADNPGGLWLAAPQQLRRVQALKLQVRAGGGADLRQLTCSVCFDDYPALQGVECCPAADAAGPANAPMPEKHFVCDECFEGHVASATDFESLELFPAARRRGLRLPGLHRAALHRRRARQGQR